MKILYCSDDKRVGFTVPLMRTLYETVSRPSTRGCLALQICLGSMQSYKRRVIQDADAKKTREYLERTGTMVYSHAPYILNLATAENKGVISALQEETDQMTKLAGGTVVHIGTGGDVKDVVRTLEAVRFRRRSLLIENAAGERNKLGSCLEEIRQILEGVDGLAVCLDTAHAFGAGLCRFDTEKAVDSFLEETDTLGDAFRLLHLNDSKVPFHACSDRHADLETGHIWRGGEDGEKPGKELTHPGLCYLIDTLLEKEVDIVLETKTPLVDVKKLKRYVYRRPEKKAV